MDFVAVPDNVRQQALERLAREYGSALLRMCYVYLKDTGLAEDAAQDTLLKAYSSLHTLREKQSEKTWLMRIAINTCRDYLRTPWMRRVDRRVDMDTLPEETQSDPLPDSQVLDAVMALPPKYKDAVLLRYYQDMKHKDIADTLGISMDAAKTRLNERGFVMKLKDKKIEILAVTYAGDPGGFPIETLTPISPPMWAYFRQLSGKEVYAAMSVQATEEVQFAINWRDDITTRHIVRFRGVDYDITRVDVFEGYKQDLTLYAKRRR